MSHLSDDDNALAARRETRANNSTGALPLYTPAFEPDQGYHFDEMIQSLKELFARDRQIASQSDATRCGICYLHFQVNELFYRDEGFYVCLTCEAAMSNQKLSMLRKQQKL